MKEKWGTRYLVTAAASVPVYKAYGKAETCKQAAKGGRGTVYRDENNALACGEDCSASLYTKNGAISESSRLRKSTQGKCQNRRNARRLFPACFLKCKHFAKYRIIQLAPSNCSQAVKDWGARILGSCDEHAVAQAIEILDSAY